MDPNGKGKGKGYEDGGKSKRVEMNSGRNIVKASDPIGRKLNNDVSIASTSISSMQDMLSNVVGKKATKKKMDISSASKYELSNSPTVNAIPGVSKRGEFDDEKKQDDDDSSSNVGYFGQKSVSISDNEPSFDGGASSPSLTKNHDKVPRPDSGSSNKRKPPQLDFSKVKTAPAHIKAPPKVEKKKSNKTNMSKSTTPKENQENNSNLSPNSGKTVKQGLRFLVSVSVLMCTYVMKFVLYVLESIMRLGY